MLYIFIKGLSYFNQVISIIRTGQDFKAISVSLYFRECSSMRGGPNKKGIAAETPIN